MVALGCWEPTEGFANRQVFLTVSGLRLHMVRRSVGFRKKCGGACLAWVVDGSPYWHSLVVVQCWTEPRSEIWGAVMDGTTFRKLGSNGERSGLVSTR